MILTLGTEHVKIKEVVEFLKEKPNKIKEIVRILKTGLNDCLDIIGITILKNVFEYAISQYLYKEGTPVEYT